MDPCRVVEWAMVAPNAKMVIVEVDPSDWLSCDPRFEV